MQNLKLILIKYNKLKSMKQSSKEISEKPLITEEQSSTPKMYYIQGRTASVKLIYRCFKYGIILSVLLLIVLSGVIILGDTSTEVNQNRKIFDAYKTSPRVNDIVDDINTLFDKQGSKYVSERTINLYLEKKNNGDLNVQQLNDQFDDLVHFTGFLVNQRYSGLNILQLPLNLYEEKPYQIVSESTSSEVLKYAKKTIKKILEKNKFTVSSSVKELKWTRVRKLIDNGKVYEIAELVKDNLLDAVWKWIQSQPQVILLIADESQINEKSNGNKKLFNKWIRQNQEDSDIIILSRYPINQIYETSKENHLKAYNVEMSIDQIQTNSLCNYLNQSLNLTQTQCSTLKNRFNTFSSLERFVDNYSQQELEQQQNEQETDQFSQILENVCANGHTHYYFYENQQNAQNVLLRNKKQKKSRLDRELQALIVKWSHLKKSMGLNKLKDIYLTLISRSAKDGNITLRQANELGLTYDFDLHQLRWGSEQEQMKYEIRTGTTCKNRHTVEQEMNSQRQEQELAQKQIQTNTENKENEDLGEQTQEDNEVVEQEYEQNFIHYDKDQQQDTQVNTQETDDIGNEENQEENEINVDGQTDQNEQNQQEETQIQHDEQQQADQTEVQQTNHQEGQTQAQNQQQQNEAAKEDIQTVSDNQQHEENQHDESNVQETNQNVELTDKQEEVVTEESQQNKQNDQKDVENNEGLVVVEQPDQELSQAQQQNQVETTEINTQAQNQSGQTQSQIEQQNHTQNEKDGQTEDQVEKLQE